MTVPVYRVGHKLFDLNLSFWYMIYQNEKKSRAMKTGPGA